MYRLPHNHSINSLNETKLISYNLIDCFLAIFGPLDANGKFTCTDDYIEEIFTASYLFNKIIYNEIEIDYGFNKEKIKWAKILRNRCEDIVAKLQDEAHIYTFDEFGEGLIVEVIDILHHNDDAFQIIADRAYNETRFHKEKCFYNTIYSFIPLSERNEEAKALYNALKGEIAAYYTDYIEELYSEGLPIEITGEYEITLPEPVKDFFGKKASELLLKVINDTTFYSKTAFDYFIEDDLPDFLDEAINKADEYYDDFCSEIDVENFKLCLECIVGELPVILWDTDYHWVMDRIINTKELNAFLKNENTLNHLQYANTSTTSMLLNYEDEKYSVESYEQKC